VHRVVSPISCIYGILSVALGISGAEQQIRGCSIKETGERIECKHPLESTSLSRTSSPQLSSANSRGTPCGRVGNTIPAFRLTHAAAWGPSGSAAVIKFGGRSGSLRGDSTLTESMSLRLPTVEECFHEDQQIQFAPFGSAFGREGLIMHDNDDFGDTAQREGWYWLGVWIRENELHQPWVDNPHRQLNFDRVLTKLEPNKDGVFVRAPGKDPYGRPTDGHENHGTTRDQLIPLIAAMGVAGKHDALQRLWEALPEDILGKHDFQGHWHDAISGQDIYASDPCRNNGDPFCSIKRSNGFLMFTGDPLPPTTYNLFIRAGIVPTFSFPVTKAALSTDGFMAGETLLYGGVGVLKDQATGKLQCPGQPPPDKLDCVDQDMNTIVLLWMSRHFKQTAMSEASIANYRSRAHSYGSYFKEYCNTYHVLQISGSCSIGNSQCCKDKACLNSQLTERIKIGIQSTPPWTPDGPGAGPFGAVRWYNRWSTGANPRLALLWEPIIEDLLKTGIEK
jgi:hypothetical protein